MSESVSQPLILRKKSRSSRFASWSGEGNSFADKMLRVLYIFLLIAIDFIMFIYSINGKLLENGGTFNMAAGVILGGVFAAAFLLIILLSFSKNLQNLACALFTVGVVVMFFNQFALFNVDTFIETWLNQKASWLTFICIIPSAWLIGLALGAIVFFAFRSTYALLFITSVLLFAGVIGVKNNEFIAQPQSQYSVVKQLVGKAGVNHEGNTVYFMLPRFPSYQFLNTIRDRNFRELRDLMVGFYAVNDFEIYPNAFVKNNDAMSNMIDIFNQVDYTSTTSANRGYSEFINNWQFIHGGLDYVNLEENRLYEHLWSSDYGISTYAMPGFNTCIRGGDVHTDRCVIKSYKTISLYDKNKPVEQNVYGLLAEWVLSLKSRDMKPVAKMLAAMSPIKGFKVTSENRRVSIEGATNLLEVAGSHLMHDNGGQFYMVYVDLPSDIYLYDEFCNVKPRNQWVALKDNSLASGGIDEKRKAYADQAKCLIGLLQMYMEDVYQSHKAPKTDVIIQGVSTIRELAGMSAGRYSNFVTDKLVSLAIRKGKKPKFLINANICLASDFTKTLIRYQDYCYSIDNMNLPADEGLSLKQNLINNSVIRGNKISNIAADYKDWYEEFKLNNKDYQKKLQQQREAELKQQKAMARPQERPVSAEDEELEGGKIHNTNIFVPTDDLILEMDANGEIKSVNPSAITSGIDVDSGEDALVPENSLNAQPVVDGNVSESNEPPEGEGKGTDIIAPPADVNPALEGNSAAVVVPVAAGGLAAALKKTDLAGTNDNAASSNASATFEGTAKAVSAPGTDTGTE